MKIFILVKTAPSGVFIHRMVQSLTVCLKQRGYMVLGIFFTGDAASIGSTGFDDLPEIAGLRQSYIALYHKYEIPLLICGRAFKERGLSLDRVCEGFCFSGNAELSSLIAGCDRLVEF